MLDSEALFEWKNLTVRMADDIHQSGIDRGWWKKEPWWKFWRWGKEKEIDVGSFFMNFVAEVAEGWEEYCHNKSMSEIWFDEQADPPYKPEGIPIEFADVIIRIFDVCAAYDIDIASAIIMKVKYNEGRSYRHGGKRH